MKRIPFEGTLSGCVWIVAAALALACGGCKRASTDDTSGTIVAEPAPAETPAETPTEQPAAKVSGGSLNDFFPKDDGDWNVVFTQEKLGFAQAKLEKDGAELATLSVSDFTGNAKGLEKFENTGMTLGGHPARPQGKNGTLVLAGASR